MTSNEHNFTRQAKQDAIKFSVKLFNINDFAYMLQKVWIIQKRSYVSNKLIVNHVFFNR